MKFGLDYGIQINDNGTWLYYCGPEAIDDPLLSVTKGKSYEGKIYLSGTTRKLKANETYRIIKEINNKMYASNEFILK